jgi:hypothetical protein
MQRKLHLALLVLAFFLLDAREASSRVVADPLLDAIIEHESRGRAGAIGGLDGQCIGLGQICLHTYAACQIKDSHDPEHPAYDFENPACLAQKQRLLDPTENLRVAAESLRSWKQLCKRTVGHAGAREIVFGYAGADGRGTHCGYRQRTQGASGRRRGWVPVKTPRVVREILDLYEHRVRRSHYRKWQRPRRSIHD